MRKFLSLVIFVSAAFVNHGGGAPARAQVAPPQQGAPVKKEGAGQKDSAKPAPNTPTLKVTELKEAGLKSLFEESVARKRPLLINFWATWCVPCRAEFPDLVKIREQFPAERLDFVTVSLDDPSEIETGVPDFLKEIGGDAMPAFLLNADDPEVAINMLDPTWRGELPATFLFDRAGTVVYIHKGRVKPSELIPVIEKTLGAKE
jgi:thiol-disulfide isomerase/thioredoxin